MAHNNYQPTNYRYNWYSGIYEDNNGNSVTWSEVENYLRNTGAIIYELRGGGNLYVFDENGKNTGKKIPFCGNAILMNGKLLFLADPVEDAKNIEEEHIKSLLIVSDEEIMEILAESGVFEKENQENKFIFALTESMPRLLNF